MKTISWGIAAAVVIGMSGCSSQQAAVGPKPEQINAPLYLCPPVDVAPEGIASKPTYVQYAVTVTDAIGSPVRGLKPSEFVVKAGDRSLPIKYFREDDGDAPESIVVVVDESGSMVNKLGVWNDADLDCVRENIKTSFPDGAFDTAFMSLVIHFIEPEKTSERGQLWRGRPHRDRNPRRIV